MSSAQSTTQRLAAIAVRMDEEAARTGGRTGFVRLNAQAAISGNYSQLDALSYYNSLGPSVRDHDIDDRDELAEQLMPSVEAPKKAKSKRMYTIYYADGSIEPNKTLDNGRKTFELDELAELVAGCSRIALEMYPIGNGRRIAIYDHEGSLKGLPFNETASNIIGARVRGTVVVCPQKMFK